MGNIIVLPETLVNKIAAGEIIERPASIVKELIENAIDAKSNKIVINIEDGGKSLISVSDNGIGMNKKNAILSLKRYATSKIRVYKDILSIGTLGFRGEALPSISSISKTSIITKKKYSKIGTKIVSKGGRIKQLKEAETSHGTIITVQNLFYNTPVRKKNLGTKSIELSHIIKTVLNISIANSKIKFKLIHNGKTIKNLLRSEKKIDRLKEIIGNNTIKNLLKIKKKNKKISLEGWISLPEINYPNSKKIHIFVNGRWVVENKIIKNSILSGYNKRIKKGRYPICFLYLTIPHKKVDINVHPSKKEIKLLNEKEVYTTLSEIISSKLKLIDNLKWNFLSINNETIKEEEMNLREKHIYKNDKLEKIQKNKIEQIEKPIKKFFQNKQKYNNKNVSKKQPNLWNTQFFSNLIIIGQFNDSYILCESKNSLIIIDQHAAHERITFEKLKLNNKKTKPKTEKFLLPELIEISMSEMKVLEKLIPHLKNQGLEIEIFGQNTFIVKSIPDVFNKKDISNLVLNIIESTNKKEINSKITNLIDKQILSFACHNSIRSKQNLDNNKIKEILNKLDKCENSSNCPHGRPIWIKIDSSFLTKKFGR